MSVRFMTMMALYISSFPVLSWLTISTQFITIEHVTVNFMFLSIAIQVWMKLENFKMKIAVFIETAMFR